VVLSYMLFRQIHFLVDVMQEQIPEFSLGSYLNYQLNMLTLLSGPIQRYQEFHAYWQDPSPLATDRHEILAALQRIMVGAIKVAFIAAQCSALFEAASHNVDRAMLGEFAFTRGFALRSGA